MSDEVYLSEEEVARRYGASRRSLARWRTTGDGPAFVRGASPIGSATAKLGLRLVLLHIAPMRSLEPRRTSRRREIWAPLVKRGPESPRTR